MRAIFTLIAYIIAAFVGMSVCAISAYVAFSVRIFVLMFRTESADIAFAVTVCVYVMCAISAYVAYTVGVAVFSGAVSANVTYAVSHNVYMQAFSALIAILVIVDIGMYAFRAIVASAVFIAVGVVYTFGTRRASSV